MEAVEEMSQETMEAEVNNNMDRVLLIKAADPAVNSPIKEAMSLVNTIDLDKMTDKMIERIDMVKATRKLT